MPQPMTISEMQEIAASLGGECLSEIYTNSKTKLRWRCAKGHEWEAQPVHIKHSKSWCPKCAGLARLTLDEMRVLAASLGGECMSETYTNSRTKLRWRCAKGHEWEAQPLHIKHRKSWCPTCAGLLPLGLDEMKAIAASRGGQCMSEVYRNTRTKLRWQCAKGHEWEATSDSIKSLKSWCPKCVGLSPLTLGEMCEIAASRGGECLSEIYTNSATKLRWRCAEGHEWEATPDNIKNGKQWCLKCSGSRAEELVRCYFEILFNGEPFPKCSGHPQLPSPGGSVLTLDGYSERLNLAFEYQGEQHYIDGIFGPPGSLSKTRTFDSAKAKGCSNAKPQPILLIKIPYTVPQTKLEAFIRGHCRRMHIQVPFESRVEDSMIKVRWGRHRLEEMCRIAASRDGECLSEAYTSSRIKLRWRCAEGHEWGATPNDIKNAKSWCPTCVGLAPLTLVEMRRLASVHGGECLSEFYTNNGTKLRWRCAKGHEWEATPGNIKNSKSWCPSCTGVAPLTIKEMHKLAASRGGECLSENYGNANTKLRWRCAKRHEWEATPHDIKTAKTWCPTCSGNVPLTMDEMRKLAASWGGECLSEIYAGSQTKLRWRCAEGHEWEATPSSLKNKRRWCPKCGRSNAASMPIDK